MDTVVGIHLITDEQLIKVVEMTVRKLMDEYVSDNVRVNAKRYLTASEVTEIFGISPTTLWRWQKACLVHPCRVGKHRRYDTEEIEKLLSK